MHREIYTSFSFQRQTNRLSVFMFKIMEGEETVPQIASICEYKLYIALGFLDTLFLHLI